MKKIVLALLLAISYVHIKDVKAEELTEEEKIIRTNNFLDSLKKDNPTDAKLFNYSARYFKNINEKKEIHFSYNVFTELTFEKLSKLTWLNSVSLDDCNLENLPESFGNLINLKSVSLSRNNLQELPESFGNLKNLKRLYLNENQLQNLPESFENLKNLTELYLHNNQLRNLPESFANLGATLRLITLNNNPLQVNGEGAALGEVELQRIFGDRVVLPTLGKNKYNITPISEETLYAKLDAANISINRDRIKDYKLPDIPDLGWDADIFMKNWDRLLHLLVLEGEHAVSYELLANDFQGDNDNLSNTEKIETRIFPRLNGFVKHIWDLPLAPGEDQGWQMYEGSIPELKKNLSFIIARMIDEKLDVDTRHVLMAMLTNALFHCPTGQKEGIETMLIALVTGVTQEALFDKIFLILAREKNMLFKVAIMPGDDGQNVHMISTYFDKLKDTLGLTAYFSAFKEKIGIMGNDPFGGSLGNALEAFYTKFNPDYLIKVIMDNIENKEEYTLRVNDEGEDLMNAKECLIESKKQRSIITDNFVGYLTKEKILPTKLKDGKPYLEGWEAYFKHDPMGEVYPEVKPEGIQMILIKMGVLKERAAL